MAAEALTEDNIPKGGIAGFIMPDEDFAVLETENARNELGSSGIAEFNTIARRMASYGRFGDDTVAHVQTGEIVVPRRLIEKSPELKESIFQHLRDQGVLEPERYVVGSSDNSINPETGLMEFGFFSDIFNGVKKTLKKAAGFVLPAVGSMIFGPVWGAALGTGVATLLQGGDVSDALKSGLGAGIIGGAASFAGGAMRGDGMGALRSAASPRNISSGFKNIGNLFSPERDFGRTFGNISGREGGVDFSKNYEKPVGKPNFYQKYLSPNRESVTNNNVDNLTKLTSTEAYKKGGDATRAALIEKFAKTTEPSLFKQYGPLAGLGLGALYAGGAFDVKEEEEIDKETGQDLIDANPEEYLIAGLDPYRGAPGPVRVATDYPLFAAKGGAMGNVFPRRTGGIMPDEGIPNKDSVKAMVMPGEFILTTDAVKGAGNGDLNRGINNLYGVMRNLENIGRRAS
jgi:hypothetical protein